MAPPLQVETEITGRILDHRPRGSRWLIAATGLLVSLFSLFAVSIAGPNPLAWLCGPLAALGAWCLLPRPERWEQVSISLGPGEIQLQGATARRLRARQVRALSTTRSGSSIVVALSLKGEHRPVLLALPRAEQAAAVCHALAVGSRGLGVLQWPLRRSAHGGQRVLAPLGLALTSLALPVALLLHHPGPTGLITMALLMSFAATLLQIARGDEGPSLTLTPQGVDLSGTGIGWSLVPYHCIEHVSDRLGLELRLTPPYPTLQVRPDQLGALSSVELAHIADQIRTASQRARGLGHEGPDTEGLLEPLQRGGESTRAWLQRLDAQASRLHSGAYRAEGYGVADLWQALDNHDASTELRLAAARVLLRVDPQEARHRVAQLAEEQREEAARVAFHQLTDNHELDELVHRLDQCGLWVGDDNRPRQGR